MVGITDYTRGIRNKPEADFRAYAFTRTFGIGANVPLGTPGTWTITLTPAPPGINAASVGKAYVRIAGTGTPEVCLIQAVTAVANGMQIRITNLNAHTGAYTITSASSGLQEAINDNPYSGIKIPNGTFPIYATVYAGVSFRMRGEGPYQTIFRAQSNNIGILDLDTSHTLIEDIGFSVVSQGVAGNYGIRLGATNSASVNSINRCNFELMYDAIVGVNADHWRVIDCMIVNFSHIAVTAHNAAGLDNVGLYLKDCEIFNYNSGLMASIGVSVLSTSVVLRGNWIGGFDGSTGMNYCIKLATPAATAGGAVISGNQLQTPTSAVIDISGFNTAILISDNMIAQGLLTGSGIVVSNGAGTGVERSSITGNMIQGPLGTLWTGVSVSGAATGWYIGGNAFSNATNGISLSGTGNNTIGHNNYYQVTNPLYQSGSGSDWTALTPINGWGNAGAPYAPIAGRVEAGRVWLRGQVQAGTTTSGTTIANLPVGFRPLYASIVTAWGASASNGVPVAVGLMITAGGAIGIQGNSLGAYYYVSFEGLSFAIA